jgi:hypothetical protein
MPADVGAKMRCAVIVCTETHFILMTHTHTQNTHKHTTQTHARTQTHTDTHTC